MIDSIFFIPAFFFFKYFIYYDNIEIITLLMD
jgi:hypothetical protein